MFKVTDIISVFLISLVTSLGLRLVFPTDDTDYMIACFLSGVVEGYFYWSWRLKK